MSRKNLPICPECKQPTLDFFTPPNEPPNFKILGTPEYIDWYRAHLYCTNGKTNCKYRFCIIRKEPQRDQAAEETEPTEGDYIQMQKRKHLNL